LLTAEAPFRFPQKGNCKLCLTPRVSCATLRQHDPDRKEIQMSEAAIIERVTGEIRKRYDECERGVIAIGVDPFTGAPVAGLALIAPDCVMFTMPVLPEEGVFIDVCLN